ncbi:hypothetical protein ACPB8Q_01835 [Methanocaldococcus indicus]|uniref:hypothetical protein n=1 Tax=Methanocaldococcus indicus TaxID=213231 RepID=UPI003C6CD717
MIISILQKVIPLIFLGVFLSNFLYYSNIIYFLQKKLNNSYVPILSVFFFSSTSGCYLLKNLLEKKEIDKNLILPLYILGMFVFGIHVIIFYIIPVAISLGYVGLEYIIIRFVVISSYLIVGLILLRKNNVPKIELKPKKFSLKLIFKDTFKQFFNIIIVFVPSVLIISYLIDLGVFNHFLGDFLDSILPPKAIMISLTGLATITGALAVAGSLLEKKVLTNDVALISILLADFLNRIVLYVRKYLPIHTSIFGKLGIKLATIQFLIYELSLLTILVIFLLF